MPAAYPNNNSSDNNVTPWANSGNNPYPPQYGTPYSSQYNTTVPPHTTPNADPSMNPTMSPSSDPATDPENDPNTDPETIDGTAESTGSCLEGLMSVIWLLCGFAFLVGLGLLIIPPVLDLTGLWYNYSQIAGTLLAITGSALFFLILGLLMLADAFSPTSSSTTQLGNAHLDTVRIRHPRKTTNETPSNPISDLLTALASLAIGAAIAFFFYSTAINQALDLYEGPQAVRMTYVKQQQTRLLGWNITAKITPEGQSGPEHEKTMVIYVNNTKQAKELRQNTPSHVFIFENTGRFVDFNTNY